MNLKSKSFWIIFIVLIFIFALFFFLNHKNKLEDTETSLNEKQAVVHQNTDSNLIKVEEEKWSLILVNRDHPVPKDFKVETENIQKVCVDKRIIPDLNGLIEFAKQQGVTLCICSGYRTLEKQMTLYDNQVNLCKKQGLADQEAQMEARRHVAKPGESEHNAGLSVDFASISDPSATLEEKFGETQEGIFLRDHATEYGFILRYPKDKEQITKVIHEPWHFRYVGTNFSKKIAESGLTFDEYWEKNFREHF